VKGDNYDLASYTESARLHVHELLPRIKDEDMAAFEQQTYVTCVEGKHHRSPFKTSTSRSSVPLDRVPTDLQGPMPTRFFAGKRYMMAIWDDATNYHWAYALEQKCAGEDEGRDVCIGERERERRSWC